MSLRSTGDKAGILFRPGVTGVASIERMFDTSQTRTSASTPKRRYGPRLDDQNKPATGRKERIAAVLVLLAGITPLAREAGFPLSRRVIWNNPTFKPSPAFVPARVADRIWGIRVHRLGGACGPRGTCGPRGPIFDRFGPRGPHGPHGPHGPPVPGHYRYRKCQRD
jgi:hypothetical protein